jgi:hypothetical protein
MIREERAMRKSEQNSKKSGAPAAAGGGKAKGLIALLLVLLLGGLAVAGQQGGPMAKKDVPVGDRFEQAVKAKEPKFKLAGKLRRKNQQENYTMLGWKADDELVSSTTYELASAAEAAEFLKKSLNAPLSVPVQTINLTRLGDEAFMRVNSPYSKEGQTELLFRKGNFVVVMSASSPGVAKRFAKHMADELAHQ